MNEETEIYRQNSEEKDTKRVAHLRAGWSPWNLFLEVNRQMEMSDI